jgi:NAD(P)-dependent dehydrogenase (short-subunit alcohol dehydrogenase family)
MRPEPALMSEGRLLGRRVLVVGAGQREASPNGAAVGNGRAMALAAAAEGATVAALDRDAAAAQETVRLIQEAGGQALPIVADASDSTSCEAAVREAAEGMGGLDGLVLNVGSISPKLRLEDADVEDWDRLFAVNVRTHFLASRYAMPLLEEGSSIVFISSIAAYLAFTHDPAYDASKAAVDALCRAVALEAAEQRIRANAVRIGHVRTPLGDVSKTRYASADEGGSPPLAFPLGAAGSSWDIAAVVMFLLSQQSRWITGQVINADGGATALFPGQLPSDK